MDNREQNNQTPVNEPAQQSDQGPTIRADRIVQTRKVIAIMEKKLNDCSRVPMRRDLGMVNVGELLNYLSQLSVGLPEAVDEAVVVLSQRQQLEQSSQQKARDTVNQANTEARATREQAEADRAAILEAAQQRAAEIEHQARATAERLLADANMEAQRLMESSEITRRAEVYAKELIDRVQMDVDSRYNTACTEINKMLSGAAAALSRSGMDLAALRDQLLSGGMNDGSVQR